MKLKHPLMIVIAGLVWFTVGSALLTIGVRFILGACAPEENRIVFLLTFALFIGLLKGRFVLGKSAKRQIARIATLPNPAHVKYLYSKGNYLLIALMMGLGMSMKYLAVPMLVRGVIDVAVGFALMNGAMCFFRASVSQRKLSSR